LESANDSWRAPEDFLISADMLCIRGAPMLLSRDALVSALFCETDRAQRMKTPLAVIYCGIDDWVRWLSQLGEPGSDAAMHEIAGRITRLLRCYDSLGQIAGGEFALVLPGCNSFNAAKMSERMNIEVFRAPVVAGNEQVQLAGCFGVAGSGGRSPFVVLRDAERALKNARVRGAGSIERCATDAEPDPAMFLIPVIEDEALRW
jgi:diguanylate cyclase (GGDEF)-like protein